MRAWLAVAFLAGCVGSDVVTCEDGRTCPAGHTCDEVNRLCLSPDQLTACVGMPNATACTADDINGECLEGVCVKPLCGDGLVVGDEQCDGENLDGATCVDLGFYDAGPVSCDNGCRFVDSTCTGYCGDGERNGDEACDGVRPPLTSCMSFGFDAGSIGCTSVCGPKLDGCARLYWQQTELVTQAYGLSGAGALMLAVGDQGKILRFADGVWTAMTSGTTVHLDDVFVTSPTDAWAVGDGGMILHFDGTSWSTVTSPTTANLGGVWATSATDAFAVGDGGVILHWNGTAWTAMTSPTSQKLTDIWGFSGSAVFVSGNGVALQYNGSAWSQTGFFDAQAEIMHAIWGTAPNDVWCGGGATTGQLRHWDGIMWSRVDIQGLGPIFSIWGTAANDVYFASYLAGLKQWDGRTFVSLYVPAIFVQALGGRGPGELFASSPSGIWSWESHGWNQAAELAETVNAITGTAIDNVFAFGLPSWRWNGSAWAPISLTPSPTGVFMQAAMTTSGVGLVVGAVLAPSSPMAYVNSAATPAQWTVPNNTNLCTGCGLYSVVAIADTFFVGSSQGLYRFTPGQATPWTAIPNSPTGNIVAVWGTSATDLYLMTTKVYHFNGSTFTDLNWPLQGTGLYLKDMVGVTAGGMTTLFTTAQGKIHRYAGGVWTDITPPHVIVPGFGVPPGPRFFAFAPDDVFLAGQLTAGATLLHWDGAAWEPVRGDASSYKALYGPSPRALFTAGSKAELLDRTLSW